MGSVFLDKIKNKRIYLKVNTKPEKIAVAAALSTACALIFNEKKKKIKLPKNIIILYKEQSEIINCLT